MVETSFQPGAILFLTLCHLFLIFYGIWHKILQAFFCYVDIYLNHFLHNKACLSEHIGNEGSSDRGKVRKNRVSNIGSKNHTWKKWNMIAMSCSKQAWILSLHTNFIEPYMKSHRKGANKVPYFIWLAKFKQKS